MIQVGGWTDHVAYSQEIFVFNIGDAQVASGEDRPQNSAHRSPGAGLVTYKPVSYFEEEKAGLITYKLVSYFEEEKAGLVTYKPVSYFEEEKAGLLTYNPFPILKKKKLGW